MGTNFYIPKVKPRRIPVVFHRERGTYPGLIKAPKDYTIFDQQGIPNPVKGAEKRREIIMNAWLSSSPPFSKEFFKELQESSWNVLTKSILEMSKISDQLWYKSAIGICLDRVNPRDPVYQPFCTASGWIVRNREGQPTNEMWEHIHHFNPKNLSQYQ